MLRRERSIITYSDARPILLSNVILLLSYRNRFILVSMIIVSNFLNKKINHSWYEAYDKSETGFGALIDGI